MVAAFLSINMESIAASKSSITPTERRDETSQHKVLDAGVENHRAYYRDFNGSGTFDIGWLDERTALYVQDVPSKKRPGILNGDLVAWDVISNRKTVLLGDVFQACTFAGFLRVIQNADDGSFNVLTGPMENLRLIRNYSAKDQNMYRDFNPYSCKDRGTDNVPDGAIPLLEGDGYTNRGTSAGTVWNYFTPDGKVFDEPQAAHQHASAFAYMPWLQCYGFYSDQPLSVAVEPAVYWRLCPKGQDLLQQVAVPNGPWISGLARLKETRVGLLMQVDQPRRGLMGLYLANDRGIAKVWAGRLRALSISPDGCRALIVSLPDPEREIPSHVQDLELCTSTSK
jgi:hypothetical protein